MTKRKWKRSSVMVHDIHSLMDCIRSYNGVWCVLFGKCGKFTNYSWVLSQQLHVLVNYIRQGYLYYPERTEEEM